MALALVVGYYRLNSNNPKKLTLSQETQVSDRGNTQLSSTWTSCKSDSECAYIPHPCCPGWTTGAFNLSIVGKKIADTPACLPKPAECIAAQPPVVPAGEIIKPVCRKNICTIEYVKNTSTPIRMGIPCKKPSDCPEPDAICEYEFCSVKKP